MIFTALSKNVPLLVKTRSFLNFLKTEENCEELLKIFKKILNIFGELKQTGFLGVFGDNQRNYEYLKNIIE